MDSKREYLYAAKAGEVREGRGKESVEIPSSGKRRIIETIAKRYPETTLRDHIVQELLRVFPKKNTTQARAYLTQSICDLNHAFIEKKWPLRIIRRQEQGRMAHFFTKPIRVKKV
ncbi:MAG: hypothetical protein HY291_00275 [Planctomycetes bacterium]|nr:hypothetical protein [Planctomycetota bacterium]